MSVELATEADRERRKGDESTIPEHYKYSVQQCTAVYSVLLCMYCCIMLYVNAAAAVVLYYTAVHCTLYRIS